ncbi:hypothetical protein HDU77_004341 [Chytriomyces hyalinus]|nr:hypothetical protein HDU77_004341 [Chytriomyces hyalinus]
MVVLVVVWYQKIADLKMSNQSLAPTTAALDTRTMAIAGTVKQCFLRKSKDSLKGHALPLIRSFDPSTHAISPEHPAITRPASKSNSGSTSVSNASKQ